MAKDVQLYALSTCVHCKNAKKFLDEKGIDYECTYVDRLSGEERQQAIDEVKKNNPNLSFPTLLIGDKCVVGFKQDEIQDALEKL